MTTLTLPDPIAAYFSADKYGADTVIRCFTTRAVVTDEGRTYTGLDAIEAWRTASATTYVYTSEPFAWEQKDGYHVVLGRVTGSFPGSPVDLRYRFRLEQDLIDSLEITA
jgi:hypothetical protein